jgi:phage portal protein BeeE
MSSLLATIRKRSGGLQASSDAMIGIEEWLSYFSYGGLDYPYASLGGTIVGNREEIPNDFLGMAQSVYRSNGVVFSCMAVRAALFAEARFQFRQYRNGKPGDLYGNTDLALLEKPWPNGTTRGLLGRMIQDVDLSGNSFLTTVGDGPDGKPIYGGGENLRITRMRPDWTTIVLGSMLDPDVTASDLNAEVLGYIYRPNGPAASGTSVSLMPWQVAHWAPTPDPIASYRGMSWLTPVLREIMSDGAMTTHKLKYFQNGATPNMVVSLDPAIKREAFEQWIEMFEANHVGYLNAYKTLYLGAGASADVVGNDLKQIDFKVVQGATETRIASAAGVPPVIAGFSEGLSAATYANYAQARRRFSDGTMRPLWGGAADALSTLINVPDDGSELAVDLRDVSFIQEDLQDAATIQSTQATTIMTLVNSGYRPDSVIAAVQAQDFGLLVHTGLVSVQLLPPGIPGDRLPGVNGAPANGNGIAPAPAGK